MKTVPVRPFPISWYSTSPSFAQTKCGVRAGAIYAAPAGMVTTRLSSKVAPKPTIECAGQHGCQSVIGVSMGRNATAGREFHSEQVQARLGFAPHQPGAVQGRQRRRAHPGQAIGQDRGRRRRRSQSDAGNTHQPEERALVQYDLRDNCLNILNDYRLKPVGCLARKRALRLKPS